MQGFKWIRTWTDPKLSNRDLEAWRSNQRFKIQNLRNRFPGVSGGSSAVFLALIQSKRVPDTLRFGRRHLKASEGSSRRGVRLSKILFFTGPAPFEPSFRHCHRHTSHPPSVWPPSSIPQPQQQEESSSREREEEERAGLLLRQQFQFKNEEAVNSARPAEFNCTFAERPLRFPFLLFNAVFHHECPKLIILSP